MNNPYLSTLTDNQIDRLAGEIWLRFNIAMRGGAMFGFDRRTVAIVAPGWLAAMDAVRDEIKTRSSIEKEQELMAARETENIGV